MSDLFGNHIVGFPTRRLIYKVAAYETRSKMAKVNTYFYNIAPPNICIWVRPLIDLHIISTNQHVKYVFSDTRRWRDTWW